MAPETLLRTLRAHGLNLAIVDGGVLRVTPFDRLTPELRDLIRANAHELVELLRVGSGVEAARPMRLRLVLEAGDGDRCAAILVVPGADRNGVVRVLDDFLRSGMPGAMRVVGIEEAAPPPPTPRAAEIAVEALT